MFRDNFFYDVGYLVKNVGFFNVCNLDLRRMHLNNFFDNFIIFEFLV